MGQLSEWIFSHVLLLMLAAGSIFNCVWLIRFRKRLRIRLPAIIVISLLHTVYGVLCVSVFAIIEGFGDPSSVGNMSLFGGVFFMPVAYFIGAKVFKRDVAQVFDIFTICMVFTLMCARGNCIFSGCCAGMPIPGMNGLRWPTREAEIVFYIILLLALGRKVLAGKNHGEIYPLYMISYGVFRFVVETFRVSDSPTMFHVAHFWALLSICIGASIYCQLVERKKRKARR